MKTKCILELSRKLALTVSVGLFVVVSASADTMMLQWNGYTSSSYRGTVDALTGSTASESINGSTPTLKLNSIYLIRFNDDADRSNGIGYLPSNIIIDSATLTIKPMSSVGASGVIHANTITESWVGSGTGSASVLSPTPSISATALDTHSMTVGSSDPLEFTITSAVQSWYSNSSSNYGVALIVDSGLVKIRSVNNGYNTTNDPILTINYHIIPEPSTLFLLATGTGLLLFLRRKRVF